MTKKRKYRQKKRAEAAEDTRRRIVEATVELHEDLGPRATTIKAIAERAGVQRLTVYRHFKDETAVFQACTSQWLTDHPLPDPASWAGIDDPHERTCTALESLYRYYRGTAKMWDKAHRDGPEVPALHEPMRAVGDYLDGIAGDLVEAWRPGDQARRRLQATLRHALAFPTWQTLAGQAVDDTEMAGLVGRWVEASSSQKVA